MKSFRWQRPHEISVPLNVSWLLGTVMEWKGRQELYERQKPEVLRTLRELALVESTESSNRIEGVTVERARLRPLVLGRARPRDRSEEEIVGYRSALNWVHTHHPKARIEPATFQRLHALAQAGGGDAGQWKRQDNEIIEVDAQGRRWVRFRPVAAVDTPKAVDDLCLAYRHTRDQELLPPLLAVANLVLDFLCIHPFRDGNGRVSRLLTLLALYSHGYTVGRYISLERLVEESKESYYEALARSSEGWHGGRHDLAPWWAYFLTVVRTAYREFEQRISQLSTRRGAKTEAVEAAIAELSEQFSISDVERLCPSVSRDMVRTVLNSLRRQKRLTVEKRGRYAIWRKLGNK
jgi:Fic family protein